MHISSVLIPNVLKNPYFVSSDCYNKEEWLESVENILKVFGKCKSKIKVEAELVLVSVRISSVLQTVYYVQKQEKESEKSL